MEYAGDDFPLLLKAKPFIDLLDYVRDEPYGSRCARAVLTAVIRMFEVGSVYDFVITEQIVEQCGHLCMSIRPETINDEVRVIDRIVSSALDRPLLSSDPDRHLAFLCHARSVLFQSDGCIAHVVTLMMSFAFRFYLSQRSSSRKADFMRAVIANLFVTILSLSDPVLQFKFSLRTVYLSLLAKSIPQTEALLGFCLEILESLPLSASECVPLFKQFLAVLVFVPDVPQRPVLSVFTAFVNVIERKKWSADLESVQGEMWIQCLHYLWAVSQPQFSTKFVKVDSNDVYYGSSEKYRTAVAEKVDLVMQHLLGLIETQPAAKPTVAFSLLEFAVMRIEIEGPVVKLVMNLLRRCAKSGQFTSRIPYVIEDLTKLSERNEALRQALIRIKLL